LESGRLILVRKENKEPITLRFSDLLPELLGINEGEKMIRLIDELGGTFRLCGGSLIY